MKSQSLHLIRSRVIEGRRATLGQKGKFVRCPMLGITARLLEHPSLPFHYGAIAPLSGAWKFQKIEIIKIGGSQIWKCTIDGMIHRRVPLEWREELAHFLDRLEREEVSRIWLGDDFTFSTNEASDWFFVYDSKGTFEHFQGEGRVFRRGIHIYTAFCQGGITQDLSKRPPATR